MPIERREILFDYTELMQIISTNPSLSMYLPKNPGGWRIAEAQHTGTYSTLSYDGKRKFAEAYDRMGDREATLLRLHGMQTGRDIFEVIGVPDNVLLQALINECRTKKIILPRSAPKMIAIGDIYVGLEIVIGKKPNSSLELA